MKPIHFAFAAIAIALSGAASAAPTASTYSFNGAMTGSTGVTAWDNSSTTKYNALNGTNYGNSESWMSTGSSVGVTVTAWASTGALSGGTTGYDRIIQSAFVDRIGGFELGITSRSFAATTNTSTTSTWAANAELDASNNPNGGNNQHAVDNQGAYESLMFSFASAVTLKDISIGFPSVGVTTPDSDATVLVYTGTGCSPSPCAADPTAGLSTRTYAQLLSAGWQVAGNLSNLSTTGTGTLTGTIPTSKYWMVGAYMDIGSAANNTLYTVGNDNIKISGLTAVRAVPEPSTLALFGLAGVALLARRRRGLRKD